MHLIPIHKAYALMSLITLTLGSFSIGKQLHDNFFIHYQLTLMDTNLLVKGFIVLLGLTIIPIEAMHHTSIIIQLISLSISILLAILFIQIELIILKKVRLKQYASLNMSNTQQNVSLVITSNPSLLIKEIMIAALVGASEEILYRGMLTNIALDIPNHFISLFSLFIINLFFGLSHISQGSMHVLTKFTLGSTCLLIYLYTGTVVAPIVLHASFNIIAVYYNWRVSHGH